MALVKVWNDNTKAFNHTADFDFEQEFKGKKVKIKAGSFVEMAYEDAVQFRGTYYPPKRDGAGNQKPESYKVIRIEGKREAEAKKWHVCMQCGDKFGTETELESHVDKNHLESMEDQKLAEKRKKQQKE